MIKLINEYLSHSAKLFPDNIAVKHINNGIEESITYNSLDRFTDSLSCYLTEITKNKKVFIPFFMHKNISSIKAIFSILKAGAAYVPIDINTPAERFERIIKKIDAHIIIVNNDSESTFKALADKLDLKLFIINIDKHIELSVDLTCRTSPVISTDIAYILFTSGSTGEPKGVMISHESVTDYIEWASNLYDITSRDVVANHAPLYFDNSTFDIYTAIRNGAILNLVPDEINKILPSILNWIDTQNISVFFCVPSVLTILSKIKRVTEYEFSSLRHIICAGEVLPVPTVRFWMANFPNIKFTNMYGPTEITVDCSYFTFKSIPDEAQISVPIGKARQNMQLFVLMDDGSISQELGAKGELLVRGISVSYGYVNDLEKTNEVFIQNPMHSLYRDVLYKTGDVVSIGDNYDFYYHGRLDNQIKHLGQRIELGEIEANISKINSVDEVVVIYHSSSNILENFIGAAIKTELDNHSEIKKIISSILPKYMIPTKYYFTNMPLPKTNNGKFDRNSIKLSFK